MWRSGEAQSRQRNSMRKVQRHRGKTLSSSSFGFPYSPYSPSSYIHTASFITGHLLYLVFVIIIAQ